MPIALKVIYEKTEVVIIAIIHKNAAALEELKTAEELPDIIFLDYNMPAVNGLEFLKRMQQIEHLKHLEVIVLSTPPEEVMVPWLDRNYIRVKYISKPVHREELEQILKELL